MTYAIIFFILLILSAFFSGTETAYFHIRKYRKQTPEKIKNILDYPQRLLVSLLTGNTIINVTIASLAAYITANIAEEYTWNASMLPSGMYYIRLISGNHIETMKAVLMK